MLRFAVCAFHLLIATAMISTGVVQGLQSWLNAAWEVSFYAEPSVTTSVELVWSIAIAAVGVCELACTAAYIARATWGGGGLIAVSLPVLLFIQPASVSWLLVGVNLCIVLEVWLERLQRARLADDQTGP